mgnify:FL=1
MDITEKLFEKQDLGYREFHAGLMPTVEKEKIIGVRTPQLRSLAREMRDKPEAAAFMQSLPHTYYEENNLHGMLISQETDYARTVARLQAFLPYVDNWATCDLIRPKAFRSCPAPLLPQLREWLSSSHPFTVRFGMEMLMAYYLDDAFFPEQLTWVAEAETEEYYVRMMTAWYFATALAKQYDAAVVFLKQRRLSAWTHRKTIQKAVESNRISQEKKAYLRSLK